MDAPTIPVSVDSSEGNFRDAPAAADAFPAITIVAILASLGEAIRAENASLREVTAPGPRELQEAPGASHQSSRASPIDTLDDTNEIANRNGDDSHTSGGTGGRRTERIVQEYTYQDFMKCKPLYFKGTEGVVEINSWIFKRMEDSFPA
ncbi:hypothetical protein Tco_0762279 [Tanacetum coccineum]